MPRLWVDTIEAHKREVEEAILTTTAALVAEHGLAAVTMSQIAAETGIGRATLYKYFPDIEAILVAAHQRHVARHLERLAATRDRHTAPRDRLRAVLEAYAHISFERARVHHGTGELAPGRHATDIAALVHRSEHVAALQRELNSFIRDLLVDAARSGGIRDDIPPGELAAFCLSALDAAGGLRTKVAAERLVELVLGGLRPHR